MRRTGRVIYVAHPLGAGPDREANRQAASQYVAAIGSVPPFAPVADWIILSGQWDETLRERGLEVDLALIDRCDEVWLCGPRVSPGMGIEKKHAEAQKKRVVDLTTLPPGLVQRWAECEARKWRMDHGEAKAVEAKPEAKRQVERQGGAEEP
jgi:hypothetical protein